MKVLKKIVSVLLVVCRVLSSGGRAKRGCPRCCKSDAAGCQPEDESEKQENGECD